MNAVRIPQSSAEVPLAMSLILAAALAVGGSARAADVNASEAQMRYQQERAACVANDRGQSRETCLREAGAALAAARQGQLEGNGEDYAKNALKRCAPLPDEERHACEARMVGLGTTSGSVAGGGILRQLVTVEVLEPRTSQSPSGK